MSDSIGASRRDVSLYVVARVTSLVGTTTSAVVMPILMYKLTGSPAFTSVLVACEILPYLLFGTIAGSMADRVDPKRLLFGIDLASAALIGSVPIANVGFGVAAWELVAVAVGLASLTVWYDAASFASFPRLVARENLTKATTRLFAINSLGAICGPGLAAGLLTVLRPVDVMLVDCASYLLSAILLALMRANLKGDRLAGGDSGLGGSHKIRNDVAIGIKFLWSTPVLRWTTMVGPLISFTGGALAGLNIVFAINAFALAKSDPRLGVLYAGGAVGGLLATLTLSGAARRFPAGRIHVYGLPVAATLYFAYCGAWTFTGGFVLYGATQFAYVLVTTNGFTLRQYLTPLHMLGRVNTFARTFAMSGQPIGAVTAGLLAETVGVRTSLALCGVPIALAAVAVALSPVRASDVMTVG